MDRMATIAANVNEDLAVRLLRALNDGYASNIGDWIVDGDEWIIESGTKVKVSECLFNYGDILYMRAPQTITTKSVEIPKPISLLPAVGEYVFVSNPTYEDMNARLKVAEFDSISLLVLLKRGRLHLTAEAAIAHSKADIEAAGGVWE